MFTTKVIAVSMFCVLVFYAICGFVAWALLVEYETAMREAEAREPQVNELESIEDFQPLF